MPLRSTRSHLAHKKRWKWYGTYLSPQANRLECVDNNPSDHSRRSSTLGTRGVQIIPPGTSSHRARKYNHKYQADITAKKRVIHLHYYIDPADRTDPLDHAGPSAQSYSSGNNHGTCMFDKQLLFSSSCRSCRCLDHQGTLKSMIQIPPRR